MAARVFAIPDRQSAIFHEKQTCIWLVMFMYILSPFTPHMYTTNQIHTTSVIYMSCFFHKWLLVWLSGGTRPINQRLHEQPLPTCLFEKWLIRIMFSRHVFVYDASCIVKPDM